MSSPARDDQEPEYRCPACTRLLYRDELERQVCRVCEDRAGVQLRELPALYEKLGECLAPGRAGDSGKVSGATRTAPIPVSLAALDLRGPGGMTSTLLSIEDSWRTALGWGHPVRTDGTRVFSAGRSNPELDLPKVVRFLTNNLPWACDRYEEAAYDLAEIGKLHSRAQAVISGVRRRRVPLGCCPTLTPAGTACGAQLHVDPSALEIKCRDCGARWHRDSWLKLGAAMRELHLPEQAA
jgi:Zn finger protein HypA/HybF involved in hydrogenase expression